MWFKNRGGRVPRKHMANVNIILRKLFLRRVGDKLRDPRILATFMADIKKKRQRAN